MDTKQRTVAEIDGFINMLRAACEDNTMNKTLENILSQPDKKRKQLVLMLVKELTKKKAPHDLIEGISCLIDDAVSEKAYEVIYKCSR